MLSSVFIKIRRGNVRRQARQGRALRHENHSRRTRSGRMDVQGRRAAHIDKYDIRFARAGSHYGMLWLHSKQAMAIPFLRVACLNVVNDFC